MACPKKEVEQYIIYDSANMEFVGNEFFSKKEAEEEIINIIDDYDTITDAKNLLLDEITLYKVTKVPFSLEIAPKLTIED